MQSCSARGRSSALVTDLGCPRDGSVRATPRLRGKLSMRSMRRRPRGRQQRGFSTMGVRAFGCATTPSNFRPRRHPRQQRRILLDPFAKADRSRWEQGPLKVHLKGTFCSPIRCSAVFGRTRPAVLVIRRDLGPDRKFRSRRNYGRLQGRASGPVERTGGRGPQITTSRIWTLGAGALTRITADLPRLIRERQSWPWAGRNFAPAVAIHGHRIVRRPDRKCPRRFSGPRCCARCG